MPRIYPENYNPPGPDEALILCSTALLLSDIYVCVIISLYPGTRKPRIFSEVGDRGEARSRVMSTCAGLYILDI